MNGRPLNNFLLLNLRGKFIKPLLKGHIYNIIKHVGIFCTVLTIFNIFFLHAQERFTIKKVVIDAGHGGKDGGCQGSFSNEKDIALAIALKTGKYIEESFPDVKVIYTRKDDRFLELHERAKIANDANADLFICIHVNSGPTTAFGTETYVMGLHKSEANLQVAMRENSSILMEDNYQATYQDFDPNSPESYIAISLMQGAYLEQSLLFAEKIQQQFRERAGRYDRGVKQAGFLVLWKTKMPSVLIETGFLTNAEEEKFLNSDIGQDYLASAIYRAFKEYKTELEKRNTKEKSIVTEEREKNIQPLNPDEIIFKVQIATSSKKLKENDPQFNGLEDIEYYEAGGLFRYTTGKTSSYKQATEIQQFAKEKGFKDAFIVAFKNGKRISLAEAFSEIKQKE